MASATILPGDLTVPGVISAQGINYPASSIVDAAVKPGADINYTKVEHKVPIEYRQKPGSAIVAETADLGFLRTAGGVVVVQAMITGLIATGADRTISIDIQKSTGGGAFASIMPAPITFANTDVLLTAKSQTPIPASLVSGDVLRIIVTVAGAAGNQAQGLVVETWIYELGQ